MKYIKLKQALHILDVVMSDNSIKHKGKAIRKRLKELPGEDVEKVVHGEWIQGQSISQECSCCGFEIDDDVSYEMYCGDCYKKPKFCPECGAKMVTQELFINSNKLRKMVEKLKEGAEK